MDKVQCKTVQYNLNEEKKIGKKEQLEIGGDSEIIALLKLHPASMSLEKEGQLNFLMHGLNMALKTRRHLK